MTYVIIAIVAVIAYFMYQAYSERRGYVEKYGSMPDYLRDIIYWLKTEFPNHEVKEQSSETFIILCQSRSYSVIFFFSWVPSGLLLRVDYSDMLNRKNVENIDFDPSQFNLNVFEEICKKTLLYAR